jgi:hypothetical protein
MPASLRRHVIPLLACLLSVSLPLPILAEASGQVGIEWRVPHDQSVKVQKSLHFDGDVKPDQSTKEDTKSPALIYILTGVVSLDILVGTLLNAYKELRYGGLVVRRGKSGSLEIENDSRLSGGMIVVDKGGSSDPEIFRVQDKPQGPELLKAITPLLGH